ncbi:MAG: DoxX family protein [Pseudomonadota bacterium]
MKTSLIIIKVLLTVAFIAAGGAKLAGVEQMVATYEALGFGQWFRYLTGVIEVAGAALLWIPGFQLWGAGLLACTMLGAIAAHLLVLGPSAVPAIALGVLAAFVAYSHRAQFPGRSGP